MNNRIQFKRVRRRFLNLFRHPLFWILTLLGNSTVAAGGVLLYYFETDVQDFPLSLLDALLWSLGMMTSVGYGPWTPVTLGGKLTSGALMLGGTLFIWSYMAFLVTGLITPELAHLESDVHVMEKDIHNLRVGKFDEPL
ncbi:MAG: ion channel [Bdellovibrionales bacterium]